MWARKPNPLRDYVQLLSGFIVDCGDGVQVALRGECSWFADHRRERL